ALKAIEITNNQSQLCACLINISDIHVIQKDFDQALTKYTKALNISKSIDNRVFQSNCLTSIGKLYQELEEYKKAKKHQILSLEISESLGDNLGKTECLTNLAILYLAEEDLDKSINFHIDALKLSKSINSKYFESKNYLGLSKAFNMKSDFKKSLNYFKLYHKINTELQNEKIHIQLKNMNIQKKIDAAKKEVTTQKIKNEELQEAFDRVSILNKIGQDITSSLDLETVMTAIYKNISTFISADLFGIALYDDNTKEIDFKYFILDGQRITGEKKPVQREGSLTSWVITNGEYLYINDLQNEFIQYVPKLVGANTQNTNSLIFVPLKTGNSIAGVITVQSYSLNAYTNQHLEIIQAVGAYSSIALENSTVHEEIYKLNKIINSEKKELEKAYLKIDRLANHDILTGLPNRRLFIELLKQELRLADRKKTKTAALFINLDDFKPVNDTMGHDAGDKVLQMVAQRFV
ncbi:MAG: tetratricopeptide repeat protein, partial [Spirochaetales bacterium]|nr:tetratricopeptide repeat protein [Spirochaetales bacterium]